MLGQNIFSSGLNQALSNQPIANSFGQLRPGQILSGKVLELYPNQRATILLGGKPFVAQLEASISVLNSYWFQVQSTGQVIRLKVMADKPLSDKNKAETLLREMGIALTKENQSFINQLLQRNISFTKDHLKPVFDLLVKQEEKELAKQVLLEMIKRDLPITKNVFDSLMNNQTNSFSAQIKDLSAQLTKLESRSLLENSLLNRLNKFTSSAKNESVQSSFLPFLTSGNDVSQLVYTIVNKAGLFQGTIDEWSEAWDMWKLRHETTATQMEPTTHGRQNLPITTDKDQFDQALLKLYNSQIPIDAKMKGLFIQLLSQLNSNVENSQYMKQLQGMFQQKNVMKKVQYVLSDKEAQLLQKWTKDPTLDRSHVVLPILDKLASKQLTVEQEKTLLELVNVGTKQPNTMQETRGQFLYLLKQTLYFTGYDHEHVSLQDKTNTGNQHTMKSLLLQMFQQGDRPFMDRLEQFLHSINGAHIQSVQEHGSMLHTAIQIPGEKLGLYRDIKIEAESRKDESSKINPDYCRVHFYLELNNIGETVIDMLVQKRVVRLTVYNNTEQLTSILSTFKPLLQSGLEKVDYHLSSVQWKRFEATNQLTDSKPKESNHFGQGVDFRI
ncbi:hypothetical protein NC661_16110 [Aquibacillus koreensis]|uniref:Flagellar hook-length control protein-like C-terminal domain-containing protein n=1 Tax=Aquibacillus koreensis TaxID=279446 RepID=A0A9X4AKX8_9BACI|nr:hypothetical protein [Aquibacillus koreensis]MCT2534506.1 hypothetical protein [Aquibacillus koreensis]MDC3421900.1 hypothetical protein [Aquibacillus koreensis]